MELKNLKERQNTGDNTRLSKAYLQFGKLLNNLSKRDLPDHIVDLINKDIDEMNAMSDSENELLKALKKKQAGIFTLLEKELKLVPQNYYRNLWLAIGMAAFGIPIGVVFGTSLGNMAFLGIGLPIGLAIGMAVGTGMDKKAMEEGRQIEMEIEY